MKKPSSRWRDIQRTNFTSTEALASFLELSEEQKIILLRKPSFALNLPVRIAEKITKKTLDDPLLRQFVPLHAETENTPSFVQDPVSDLAFRRSNRLLQKYKGRALLLISGGCAMHCRYCFRKHYPYEASTDGFANELSMIAADPSLREIILSGGDPLSLSNASLSSSLTALEPIAHIKRVRFHTRFPIGIPERIDDPLLSLLKASSKQLVFVFHINHPKELDEDIRTALKKLQNLNIFLLNQSTLLKGVNDSEETLLNLSETLIAAGILPYYLNLLDKVAGSAHFDVTEERGLELLAYLRAHTSGYAVPKLVREIPGHPNKTPIQ